MPDRLTGDPSPSFRLRRAGVALLGAISCGWVAAAPAGASVSHVIQPGETLSGIAAANGLTTESLAAWNGLSTETFVISGASIIVPTTDEAGAGGAASESSGTSTSVGSHTVVLGESLSSIAAVNGVGVSELAAQNGLPESGILLAGTTLSIPAASAASSSAPAPSLGTIPSPWGDLYLDASAAQAWNAMRAQSLSDFGVDLYPAGTLSAYRTSGQQGDLYELFLGGLGAPANPPGTSSHELGTSVDLATAAMRNVVDQIGWQYGWGKYEAPSEWWHVTYGG